MWIEVNERLINLDGVIEAHYEDGELIMYFVDGDAGVRCDISNEKWQKIQKALLNQNAEMVYTFSSYGCGGKGRTE